MWVPPAFLYLGIAAYLFVGWLQATAERRAAYDRAARAKRHVA